MKFNPLLMLSKNEAVRYLSMATNPTEIHIGPNFAKVNFGNFSIYVRPPLHGNSKHLWNESQLTDAMMMTLYKSNRPLGQKFFDLEEFTEESLLESLHQFICKPVARQRMNNGQPYLPTPKTSQSLETRSSH